MKREKEIMFLASESILTEEGDDFAPFFLLNRFPQSIWETNMFPRNQLLERRAFGENVCSFC